MLSHPCLHSLFIHHDVHHDSSVLSSLPSTAVPSCSHAIRSPRSLSPAPSPLPFLSFLHFLPLLSPPPPLYPPQPIRPTAFGSRGGGAARVMENSAATAGPGGPAAARPAGPAAARHRGPTQKTVSYKCGTKVWTKVQRSGDDWRGPWRAEDASRADEMNETQSGPSQFVTQPGDSVISENDLDEEVGGGSGSPPQNAMRRQTHREVVTDTIPRKTFCERRAWTSSKRKNNEGNMSVMFGNWGSMPSEKNHGAQRRRVELQLRHNPALVVVLAECEESMESILQRPGKPAPQDPDALAAAGESAAEGGSSNSDASAVCAARGRPQAGDCPSLQKRAEYEYLTLRGREQKSLCIAARSSVCRSLELLYWERHVDGVYTTHTGDGKKRHRVEAFSRIMVAELTFDHTYAEFGNKARVCAVHLHRMTAKACKGFKQTAKEWWPKLAGVLQSYNVDILCGDFNMALTQVVPELRKEQCLIETAAVYFWRAKDGTPCLDSCGIFFLNRPGLYKLQWSLKDLHGDDETGLLFNPERFIPSDQKNTPSDKIFYHTRDGGPGQPYTCYHPKGKPPRDHIRDLLSPCEMSARLIRAKEDEKARRAEAEKNGDTRWSDRCDVRLYKASQKLLAVDVVEFNGSWHGGAHYPLMCSSDMQCARSDDKKKARRIRKKEKRAQKCKGAAMDTTEQWRHQHHQHHASTASATRPQRVADVGNWWRGVGGRMGGKEG